MIRLLDGLHLGRPHVICAGLVGTEKFALIDCGPETCFAPLVAEMRRLGVRPENVTHVLATHIHLDHSGGAWRWAEEFGATVCVHPRGAAHLAEPGKLVASAAKIFGADMPRLWGEIRAVPADRLRVVADGEEVAVGAGRLRAVETPGHAPHHHAWWLESERTLFAGDVCGVSIAGGPVLPPCPPPDIDLAAWRTSLARIRALHAERLVLTHWGEVADIAARLDELEARLRDWSQWMLAQLRTGLAEEQIVPRFQARVADELRASGLGDAGIATYEQADPAAMSVTGLARYWRKHHPEALI